MLARQKQFTVTISVADATGRPGLLRTTGGVDNPRFEAALRSLLVPHGIDVDGIQVRVEEVSVRSAAVGDLVDVSEVDLSAVT